MIKFSINQASSLADVLFPPVWNTVYDVDIEISELSLKMLTSQKITDMERKYLIFIIVKVL